MHMTLMRLTSDLPTKDLSFGRTPQFQLPARLPLQINASDAKRRQWNYLAIAGYVGEFFLRHPQRWIRRSEVQAYIFERCTQHLPDAAFKSGIMPVFLGSGLVERDGPVHTRYHLKNVDRLVLFYASLKAQDLYPGSVGGAEELTDYLAMLWLKAEHSHDPFPAAVWRFQLGEGRSNVNYIAMTTCLLEAMQYRSEQGLTIRQVEYWCRLHGAAKVMGELRPLLDYLVDQNVLSRSDARDVLRFKIGDAQRAIPLHQGMRNFLASQQSIIAGGMQRQLALFNDSRVIESTVLPEPLAGVLLVVKVGVGATAPNFVALARFALEFMLLDPQRLVVASEVRAYIRHCCGGVVRPGLLAIVLRYLASMGLSQASGKSSASTHQLLNPAQAKHVCQRLQKVMSANWPVYSRSIAGQLDDLFLPKVLPIRWWFLVPRGLPVKRLVRGQQQWDYETLSLYVAEYLYRRPGKRAVGRDLTNYLLDRSSTPIHTVAFGKLMGYMQDHWGLISVEGRYRLTNESETRERVRRQIRPAYAPDILETIRNRFAPYPAVVQILQKQVVGLSARNLEWLSGLDDNRFERMERFLNEASKPTNIPAVTIAALRYALLSEPKILRSLLRGQWV